jgi:hypothetical protein
MKKGFEKMKRVVLIAGKIDSGKNKFAEFLKEYFGEKTGLKIETDLFARSVKNGAKEDFRALADLLNSYADRMVDSNISDLIRIDDCNWYEDKTELTRVILQIYGTDIFRHRVDENWWIWDFKKRLDKSNADIILVTDVRFENEINSLIESGHDVYSIKLERVDRRNNKLITNHESENSLDGFSNWNYVVHNHGSLEDLKSSADIVSDDIIRGCDIEEKKSFFNKFIDLFN